MGTRGQHGRTPTESACLPTSSSRRMRKSCELRLHVPTVLCEEPAVDFVTLADETIMYLCAEHFDRFIAISKALKEKD